jgi:hypothetical protein
MTAEDPSSRPAGGASAPAGIRNLFLERLKALLSQEHGVLDELLEDDPAAARRRELYRRLFGDARALRGDALAFGLPRVSEIGSAVESLVAELLSAEDGRRSHRVPEARSEALDALRSALADLDAEVDRAATRDPEPPSPPACLPKLAGARESLMGDSTTVEP